MVRLPVPDLAGYGPAPGRGTKPVFLATPEIEMQVSPVVGREVLGGHFLQ